MTASRPLTVAVSLVGLAHPRTTGLERYGIELVRALRELAPPDVQVRPVVHGWAAEVLGGPCTVVPRGLPRPVACEAWLASWLARRSPDLLHVTSYGAPAAARTPFVLTVHDTTAWDVPEAQSRGGRWYFRPAVERSLRSSQLRALVSHAHCTAADVKERWHLTVPAVGIGCGLAPEWFTPIAAAREPGPLRLLTVGTLEPRKGLHVVAAAVGLLRTAGVAFEWRLVGRQGWGGVAPPEGVQVVGAIDDVALRREYSRADVLVAPSLAEGFDLPVAEGLAAGAQVVASDIPVHREVFGAAARLVPVGDPVALADELTLLAESVSRAPEQSWAARAGRQEFARGLSWAGTVDALVEVWRAAAR